MITTCPGHMHARLIIKSSRCIECSIRALVKKLILELHGLRHALQFLLYKCNGGDHARRQPKDIP